MALEDWEDITPDAVTIPSDDTTISWQPAVAGPQTEQDIGRSGFITWGQEWLKVGPTKNAGGYTDIQKALNQVKQAGGGAIYILNGDYQAPASWYVPDVNLEVLGQSQGGVILKNLAGSDLFVLHNLTKTFNFHQFSIASQNVAAASKMFSFYGDTDAENTASLFLESISAVLLGGNGDYLLQIAKGQSGQISVDQITSTGGWMPIYCNGIYYAPILVTRSKISSPGYACLVLTADIVKLTDNTLESSNIGLEACCITSGIISGNTVKGAFHGGIAGVVSNLLTIKGNDLISTWAGEQGVGFTGISCQVGTQLIIEGNKIRVESSKATDEMKLIRLEEVYSSNITGNNLYGDYVQNANYHYGVHSHNSSVNVITGNNINLVNNDAKDIGIKMDANSDNNQGSDNITYNTGVSISDLGAGNTVTAKDV